MYDRCEVCTRVLDSRPDPNRRRCAEHLNQLALFPLSAVRKPRRRRTTRRETGRRDSGQMECAELGEHDWDTTAQPCECGQPHPLRICARCLRVDDSDCTPLGGLS
jgi:hypothetical protein